jgi:hypothetical protein
MWNVSFPASRRIVSSSRLISRIMLTAACTVAAAQAAPLATTTTLTLSSSSIAWHTPVTLSAQVAAGGTPVSTGFVTFCDASGLYAYCEDSAIVGTGQLVAGTATYTFFPAPGSHKYTAKFDGTTVAAASTSSAQSLTVTGLYPTTTSIAATGNPSGYDLTATVVGFANHPPLVAGTVSFQDTTAGNYVLGTASLGTPTSFTESFNSAPNSPIQTGNQPAAGATADFNGDGKPDLAIMNSYDNSVYILLGNGDGTFTAANGSPITGVGTIPCVNNLQISNCSIAAGDFDNNGTADLAVTSDFDNEVFILMGNGDGTFTPANGSPITVGNFPEWVSIGDFNNDGRLDLAVANGNDNTLSILLGNGNGTFTPANGSPVPTGGFPFFLAIADFNQNGTADIAVSNESDNTVSILLGNGDGTFTQANGSPISGFNYNPAQIVAADVNGDGIPDLAVTNFTAVPPSTVGTVSVLLGKGDGTFNPAPGSPISVGVDPFAMVAGDFNQDGKTDLAVSNYGLITDPSTQTLTLLLGNGSGGFTSAGTPTQLADSPNALVAADYNEDGTIDLAIPNIADFDVSILLNQFTQTATASVPNITIAGTGTHYVDAVYEGDTSFATSTSSTIPLQGSTVVTTLTLTATPAQQMITMPVTFTAQLGSASNQPLYGNPSGTVTFYDQSVSNEQLGTAPMNASGQAVLTVTSIGPGVHSIIATYSGGASFPATSSNTVSVQIDEMRLFRVGNNNTTILPGTTVVYAIQVQPQVATTFLYNVSFTTTGLPAGATATFSPTTLAAGGPTTNITMTVTTATTASNTPPPSPFGRLPLALGLLVPLLGSRAVRRRLRQIPPFLGVALLAALSLTAVAGLSGCSGAGLFAARKVPYTITVIATEGTVQRTTEVPLAIQ